MAGLEKRVIGLVVITMAFGWFAVSSVQASESRQAKKAYEKNDYQAAADTYQKGLMKNPESDVLNYGMGTTLYKQEKYPEAIQHLEKSLLSNNPDLQSWAHYNLGNAYYRDGIHQENMNLPQTVQQLEKSLEQYSGALKHNDKDEDAKYNYEFVKKELERLKEKLQKQKQKNSSSQNQSQKKSNDQQKQDQGQNQQNKSSSGSQDKSQEQQSQQQQSGAGGEGKNRQDQQNQVGNTQQQSDSSEQKKNPPESSKNVSGNDQQNQEGSSSQEKQPQALDQPAPGTASAPPQNGNIPQGQLSSSEAKMLLENYQNDEEPKGLLNFMKNKGQESPVLNDW